MDIHPRRYLNQLEAIHLDQELFNECHFGVEQLMELAGYSCACAINDAYPESKTVLVVVGPGNNGGDGLVCARHLKLFGYTPEILYPISPPKSNHGKLIKQCEMFDIPFLKTNPTLEDINSKYTLVVDALFGFSFKPPVRKEFHEILKTMVVMKVPCCSIDIPSGWNVEDGPIAVNSLKPEMLISLTAPKLCAKLFNGQFHYLGGRFVPPKLLQKYKLDAPDFLSSNSFVRLK
uniref:NAD(P)H-hydrate epimerase n=1 Tax=Scapholeberis mucronata TaxID=202097 RepID=A0A4Y7NLV1_9CRUS|nr:EOG090X0AXR [Scapholeberis mucronata]SVE93803.1 EOG090X0AXR [Scapholeberis mucronata]